jgi:hypothetical protein
LTVKKSLLLFALVSGMCATGSNARADGWFKSTGMAGLPRSGTWNTTLSGLYFNNSSTVTGEIVFPLTLESTVTCPSTCNWQAWVFVGASPSSSPPSAQCTLYLVSDAASLFTSAPAAASPTVSSNALYGLLSMSIGYSTLYTSAYIDCFIPPRSWVGNVQWLF